MGVAGLGRMLLGQSFGQFEQGEHYRLFAPRIDLTSLLLAEIRSNRHSHRRRHGQPSASTGQPMSYYIRLFSPISTSDG